MTYQVTIWHNVNRDVNGHPTFFFHGYQPGDAVTPAFTFTWPNDDEQITDYCFHVFNAPEDYLDKDERKLADRYRVNRLRSLSVGDVIQVGNKFWACKSVGWEFLGTDVPMNVAEDPWSNW